jgi:molybdopterin-guanine dinucleotide biosynthesis protein A
LGTAENSSRQGVRIIKDIIPDCGPLGGIYAGLLQARTEYNLFLSCDMPFITPHFMRFMVDCALESKADVTVVQSPHGRLQALCGVYRRRAVTGIGLRLKMGNYKTAAYCHHARCRIISWSEVTCAGFRPNLFANLNTPEEYEAAQKNAGPAVLYLGGLKESIEDSRLALIGRTNHQS